MDRTNLQEPITERPALLVVFPCLNEEKFLDRLVRQFAAALEGWPARLVIVDGGSTDASLSIAKRLESEIPAVSVLSNPHKLQSAAVNLAVSTFGDGCEYLIRVDVHASYPSDYCDFLVKEVLRQKADSVVVAMTAEGRGWFQKAAALAQNSVLGNGGAVHRQSGQGGRWVDHGHHALMRLEAFRAVGGYDETFSHNEDAELDWRLCRAGHKIWLTDLTSVVYFPRSSAGRLFAQYYNYGCGRARNIIKNAIHPKPRQLILTGVAPICLLALAFPLSELAAIPALLWVSLSLGFGLWVGREEKLSVGLGVGLAAITMHLGWSVGFLTCWLARKRCCS